MGQLAGKAGIISPRTGTTQNIHGIVDTLAHLIRALLLHYSRENGRLLVLVQHGVHQLLGGQNDVRVRGNASEVLLYTFQFRKRNLKPNVWVKP